jgi:non-specific serine/threonine protein kinase
MRLLALAAVVLAAGWTQAAPLPEARGEVAAALVGSEIVVVGGFVEGGGSSARVDAYDPARDAWRRLPDLPYAVNHALAAGWRGRLAVAGGYAADGRTRAAFLLERGRWRPLPDLPYRLAAGGAAVVGDTLYLVGGVAGPPDRSVLPQRALALDLARPGARWRFVPAPVNREHLGVAALAGRIYAVGGRTAGLDTNTFLAESWAPGERAWRTLPRVPEARGGTALAAGAGRIFPVGGERPQGTIASVYAYAPGAARWTRLPDLPTPRHGLGAVVAGDVLYVLAGGRTPGLAVSDVVERLDVGK